MAAAAQSGACRARAGARQPSSAVLPRVQPLPVHRLRRAPLARGIGKDVVEGWLDLAKLVASEGSKNKSPYEELAFKIGRDVYVDIAGWHLFLRDMSAVPGLKMSQALATQLGPEAAAGGRGGLRESDVAAVLKKIPVELGAGKTRVSLFDVMPSMCCLAAPDEQQEQLEAAMEALRGLAGQAAAGADPGGWLARFELNYRKLRNWVARAAARRASRAPSPAGGAPGAAAAAAGASIPPARRRAEARPSDAMAEAPDFPALLRQRLAAPGAGTAADGSAAQERGGAPATWAQGAWEAALASVAVMQDESPAPQQLSGGDARTVEAGGGLTCVPSGGPAPAKRPLAHGGEAGCDTTGSGGSPAAKRWRAAAGSSAAGDRLDGGLAAAALAAAAEGTSEEGVLEQQGLWAQPRLPPALSTPPLAPALRRASSDSGSRSLAAPRTGGWHVGASPAAAAAAAAGAATAQPLESAALHGGGRGGGAFTAGQLATLDRQMRALSKLVRRGSCSQADVDRCRPPPLPGSVAEPPPPPPVVAQQRDSEAVPEEGLLRRSQRQRKPRRWATGDEQSASASDGGRDDEGGSEEPDDDEAEPPVVAQQRDSEAAPEEGLLRRSQRQRKPRRWATEDKQSASMASEPRDNPATAARRRAARAAGRWRAAVAGQPASASASALQASFLPRCAASEGGRDDEGGSDEAEDGEMEPAGVGLSGGAGGAPSRAVTSVATSQMLTMTTLVSGLPVRGALVHSQFGELVQPLELPMRLEVDGAPVALPGGVAPMVTISPRHAQPSTRRPRGQMRYHLSGLHAAGLAAYLGHKVTAMSSNGADITLHLAAAGRVQPQLPPPVLAGGERFLAKDLGTSDWRQALATLQHGAPAGEARRATIQLLRAIVAGHVPAEVAPAAAAAALAVAKQPAAVQRPAPAVARSGGAAAALAARDDCPLPPGFALPAYAGLEAAESALWGLVDMDCLAAPDEQLEQLEAAMEALRRLAGQAAAGANPGGRLARFELNYLKLRNWVARRNTPRIQQVLRELLQHAVGG
ncbi:hypothetical protein HT031_003177 [Scenedesmus sp. PABB004]|nr:hypothetical protein HT031_003177 [Scenedesmus sp. PABB004]